MHARARQAGEKREQDHMPVPIKVNSTDVVITPFFNMQHKETLHSYRKGIRSQIESERDQYPVQELVSFLKLATRTCLFDRKQTADIYRFVGFEFGFIHGGILTPERTPRSDITTLVAFDDNQDAIQGYKAGRQWFFDQATLDERTMTDNQLIERLRELTKEAVTWHDPEGVWFFSVGCLLGELSGNLFPLTDQERQQREAEAAAFMQEYLATHEPDQERQEQETEPLPVPVLEPATVL